MKNNFKTEITKFIDRIFLEKDFAYFELIKNIQLFEEIYPSMIELEDEKDEEELSELIEFINNYYKNAFSDLEQILRFYMLIRLAYSEIGFYKTKQPQFIDRYSRFLLRSYFAEFFFKRFLKDIEWGVFFIRKRPLNYYRLVNNKGLLRKIVYNEIRMPFVGKYPSYNYTFVKRATDNVIRIPYMDLRFLINHLFDFQGSHLLETLLILYGGHLPNRFKCEIQPVDFNLDQKKYLLNRIVKEISISKFTDLLKDTEIDLNTNKRPDWEIIKRKIFIIKLREKGIYFR